MLKDDVKIFIQDLPIPDDKKQELLAKLDKEGITEDLFADIKTYLAVAEDDFVRKYQANLQVEESIDVEAVAEAQKDLEAASQEFDSQMQTILQEADDLYAQASQAIDKASIEEIKQSI